MVPVSAWSSRSMGPVVCAAAQGVSWSWSSSPLCSSRCQWNVGQALKPLTKACSGSSRGLLTDFRLLRQRSPKGSGVVQDTELRPDAKINCIIRNEAPERRGTRQEQVSPVGNVQSLNWLQAVLDKNNYRCLGEKGQEPSSWRRKGDMYPGSYVMSTEAPSSPGCPRLQMSYQLAFTGSFRCQLAQPYLIAI